MTSPSPLFPAPSSGAFHQVLTSASRNLDSGDLSLGGPALGLKGTEDLRVSKRRLHGGRQEGVDLVVVDNGLVSITVVPTRGMGILDVRSSQLDLKWDSPIRDVVHPHFVRLESRGGLGWLEGFNEWLVRCGLEFAGAPGRDKFITNTGAEAEMDLTLHGKIANIPASEVEVVLENQPRARIRLRGKVAETMFYGPKLELWTELTLDAGSTRFTLEDTVVNAGGAAQEFELIYHINFGPPLLEAGAEFVGAARKVTPVNETAARAIKGYSSYQGPTAGFVEQVYFMDLLPDAKGTATTLLKNAAGDRAVSLAQKLEQLPCFTLWKNTNSLEEGYVTGLEPGTNFPNNRKVEREAGRVQTLEPGEQWTCALEFGIHSNATEIQNLVQQIRHLGGRADAS